MFGDDERRRRIQRDKNINAAVKPMMAVCAIFAAVIFFFPIIAIYCLSKEIIRILKELFQKTIKNSLFINSLFIVGIFITFTGLHYIDKIIKFYNEEITKKPSIFFSYIIERELTFEEKYLLAVKLVCIALLVVFIIAFIFLWRFSSKWTKLHKYLTRSIIVLLGCFILPCLVIGLFLLQKGF